MFGRLCGKRPNTVGRRLLKRDCVQSQLLCLALRKRKRRDFGYAEAEGRRSEIAERIHRGAVHAHLEVQVVPEAVPGAADVADDLALRDLLADRRPDRRLVCVRGREPAAVVDDLPLRYVGFTVPDEFFVGYGFDLDERWRGLPDLRLLRAG